MTEAQKELMENVGQLLKAFEHKVGITGCDLIFPDTNNAFTWNGSEFVDLVCEEI